MLIGKNYINPFGPSVCRIFFISLMVSCWAFLLDILTNFISRSIRCSSFRHLSLNPSVMK